MKIKVIGKGHFEGTSKKSGKPYNFNLVYYLGKQHGVEGVAGQQLMLDPVEYPLSLFVVGTEYNVEFDPRGYCIGVEAVK